MKPVSFAPLDFAIILLFVAGIGALGFSARLRSNSLLQYIVAGRMLTLPVFVATLVSTWYGGILGMAESTSYYGLGTWLLMGVPYYVFAILYALVFAKRVRGAEEISIPERLESRFGRPAGLVGALLVFCLAVPAAHVLMLGVLTQAMTGWGSLLSILVGTGLGILFLYRGGLLADARMSLLAFVMMFVGFGVMAAFCLMTFPPGETWGQLPDKNLLSFTGGKGPLFIVSFFLLGAWTLVDPAFHQRVSSAESPEIGRRGVFVSVGFWVVSDMLLITAGMYAVSLLAVKPDNPLLYYPALGDQVLPAGLKAMFFCGMLGTILAAMVGYTLVSGATFGREVIGRLRSSLSEDSLTKWTRIGLIIGCGIAVLLARSINSVVALWYSWAGAVIGALLIPVSISYGLIPSRASKSLVTGAMAVSFLLSLGWLVYGISNENPFLEVTWFEQNVSLGTLIPGVAVSAIIIGIGGLFGKEAHDGRRIGHG